MSRTHLNKEPEFKIIDVDLVNSFTETKRQIISPPDSKPQKAPDTARYLAEKDSFAEKEQIRRGDVNSGPAVNVAKQNTSKQNIAKQSTPAAPANPKNSSPTQNPAPRPPTAKTVTQQPKSQKLDLSPDIKLLNELTEKSQQANSNSKNSQSNAQPFSRAPGANAQFLGFYGSNDFLPQVTDGDITLLNAKADKFAVFVRRVAIRVFNLLKQHGWDYLSARDFISLNRLTSIRATLDPQGNFKSITLESSSGSTSFDRIVERAVTQGANDPNPPPAAKAADGNYRFIFQSRSWSQTYPGGRNRAPGERRWLLLQTGLE